MIHQLIDESRQKQSFFDQFCAAWCAEYRQRQGTIFCGKGCSGCCSLVVNCTFPEALLVAQSLTEEQRQLLRSRAEALKETADQSGSLKDWLSSYRQRIGACLFLDQNGACSIYQIRPLSCRSLISTKEPGWCTTDFSTLNSEEKQAFMASLDRSAVSFPTHYAATPQELGQELEAATLQRMDDTFGFSLLGCLPWLVWIEQEYRISDSLGKGRGAVVSQLKENGLINPFMIIVG